MDGWDGIFFYSRKEAIADGVLVDVSTVAQEAGFRYSLVLTEAVWAIITAILESRSHQDIDGRLWDVLFMAFMAISRSKNKDCCQILYDLILERVETRQVKTKDGLQEQSVLARNPTLKMVFSPGDEGEPVITIMLPHED